MSSRVVFALTAPQLAALYARWWSGDEVPEHVRPALERRGLLDAPSGRLTPAGTLAAQLAPLLGGLAPVSGDTMTAALPLESESAPSR